MKDNILSKLSKLTGHKYIELTTRGNTAIRAALSAIPTGSKVLIPEEGGWISYKTLPAELGLDVVEVRCREAKINLQDLQEKVSTKQFSALLYQNPGGYFAEQEMKQIYQICQLLGCLVILDVSGSIGTELGNGKYADFLVCSFGKWKLVEAQGGGFISANKASLWGSLAEIKLLADEISLVKINQKIDELPERIAFLQQIRDSLISDLEQKSFEVVHPEDNGFVVVVKYHDETEKAELVEYCQVNELEYTLCPRYIRLNEPAISIEIKRLQKS